MGDVKVEPVDRDQPEPRSPPLGPVIAAGVVGAILFLLLTSPQPPASTATTTLPLTTTSPVPGPRSATLPTPARALTLAEMIPESKGRLHVVEGEVAGVLELVTWEGDQPARPSLMAPRSGLRFDASDSLIATTLTGRTTPVRPLLVGRPGDPEMVEVAGAATSFAWHATIPGRLAWMEPEGPSVCWTDVDWAGSPPIPLAGPTCLPAAGDSLLGFDDRGFLISDPPQALIRRLDSEGRVLGTVPGEGEIRVVGAEIGADGRVLLTLSVPGGGFGQLIADSLLGSLQPLPTGQFGPLAGSEAASSPHFPVRYALLFPVREDRYRVEVVYSNGRRVAAFNLDGVMWGIDWDSTGRYLLVPGVVGEGDQVLYVLDTATRETTRLDFERRVEDAALVVPAGCEDASALAAGLVGEPVEAAMVQTRDPALGTWYFLSARLDEGRIATWALPGYQPESPSPPIRVLAVDETARELGIGEPLDPTTYGMTDWRQFDGAVISRNCPHR